MEVIVVEDALMYILKKDGNPSDINSWKIADSLRIEVLTQQEFENKKRADGLNPSVYYYIYSDPITFKEYPVRADYGSDEEFQNAVTLWNNSAYILQGQYMSAAWGQDLENRLKYKADKANVNATKNKLDNIEQQLTTKIQELTGKIEDLTNRIVILENKQ